MEDPDGNPVEGPDGEAIVFTVHRGELKKVEFKVEQPGVYRLVCQDHLPTMVMNIHVMAEGR